MLQIRGNWQFTSVINEITSSDEENAAAAVAAEREEELRWTNLEIWMEAATEAAKTTERGMKEAAKEAEVKGAATKDTAFLSLLVRVYTYMCKSFNIVGNVHGYR